jgi:hypothetical protein
MVKPPDGWWCVRSGGLLPVGREQFGLLGHGLGSEYMQPVAEGFTCAGVGVADRPDGGSPSPVAGVPGIAISVSRDAGT